METEKGSIKRKINSLKNLLKIEDNGFYLFLVQIAIVTFFIISGKLVPQDDYWRHLANTYFHDFSKLYFDSWLPSVNLWVGYERILEFLRHIFGEYSYIPLQLISFTLFTAGFLIISKNLTWSTRTFFYALFILIILHRISLARPVSILSSLFFFLWVYESRAVRLLAGFVFAPLYWMFFLFTLPLSLKERFMLIHTLLGFFFWSIYGGSDYFFTVLKIFIDSYDAYFLINEKLGLIAVLGSPAIFSLFILTLVTQINRLSLKEFVKLDLKTFFAICFYLLSNQIRFFYDSVVPLVMTYLRFVKIRIPEYVAAFSIIGFIVFMSGDYKDYSDVKNYGKLLEGSKIIMLMDSLQFQLNYYLKDYNIRTTPPMEIEWADENVKSVLKYLLEKKTVDCNNLLKTSADVFIENILEVTDIPECLSLIGVYRDYRLWKIIRSDNLVEKNGTKKQNIF